MALKKSVSGFQSDSSKSINVSMYDRRRVQLPQGQRDLVCYRVWHFLKKVPYFNQEKRAKEAHGFLASEF